MKSEKGLPTYEVRVKNCTTGSHEAAFLEEAEQIDMPSVDSANWTFNWREIWNKADFDCEAIIKCCYKGVIVGLIRFGAYPYGKPGETPKFIFIEHLQSTKEKTITPVGQWLIWYAIDIGLKNLPGDSQGVLLKLHSLEASIPYYQDKIMMEGVGSVPSAPGEELHAFIFTKENAEQFTKRIEGRYGKPQSLL